MNTGKVVIYSGHRCAYCNAAKRLLDRKNVDYTEINVDEDPARREEMISRTQRQTVPQIFINEQHVGGFDDLSELNQSGGLDALLAS